VRDVGEREPYRDHLTGFAPHNFASPGETERRLRAAGFEDVRCGLQTWPVRPEEPREFIETVCLGAHFERLPEPLREPLLEEVLEMLGPEPELDYVRLNISARRGATPA
jgi:trans-aconitate 2-methyltransferase